MRKQIISGLVLLFVLAFVSSTNLQAQLNTPSASPGAKVETTVGLTDVHLTYSRPSKKGRTIFAAEGLVPYGSVWRTGANQASKITFGDAVMINGTKLEAGDYAILSKPGADAFEVMFFPYESGSWNSYLEKTPAVTVKGKVSKLTNSVESFTMDINNYQMEGAHLVMMWDRTKVEVPFKVEVKERVMADIEAMMAGPSGNDYYQAASFMLDAGGDMDKALTYIQKANMMSKDDPRYWMVRREALILAELGRKTEAVKKAEESLALAEKAGNADYVRLNKDSIKEWKK
jgi:hypothetical protein